MSEAEQSDHLNEAVYAEQVRLLYAVTKYRPALHLIFAIVVIGGLVTSTILTMLILPVLYRWIHRRGTS